MNSLLLEAQIPEVVPTGRIISSNQSTVIVGNSNTLSTSQYIAAIQHYIESGAVERRNPSPLFDTSYYLEQNPDIASALAGEAFEGDPLLHYVSTGVNEGRDPNPLFDTSYYLEQNPDVVDSGFNPLEHYILFGSSEGRDPSPNFDADEYLSQNPDIVGTGIDPLTDFLTTESI